LFRIFTRKISANNGGHETIIAKDWSMAATLNQGQPTMKNTIRSIVLVSSLSALASFATAQVLNSAASAAGAVRAPAITPPPPPPPPPAPAAAANIAAQGAAASATAVKRPLLTPVSANAAGAAQGSAAASSAGIPNINAQTRASAQGQASGVAFSHGTANQASVSLDASGTEKTIRGAAFAMRESVNAEVQARLEASATAVAELRARADAAGEKSRAAFAKALTEVRQRERELRANLKASVQATKESSWGEVQSALAQSYGAYAQAVVQAEAAVQSEATTAPKS